MIGVLHSAWIDKYEHLTESDRIQNELLHSHRDTIETKNENFRFSTEPSRCNPLWFAMSPPNGTNFETKYASAVVLLISFTSTPDDVSVIGKCKADGDREHENPARSLDSGGTGKITSKLPGRIQVFQQGVHHSRGLVRRAADRRPILNFQPTVEIVSAIYDTSTAFLTMEQCYPVRVDELVRRSSGY